MNGKKGENGTNGTRPIVVALYVLGSILSGSGGSYLWMRNSGHEIVAPDRFTGTQAAVLQEKVSANKEAIERHVENHPDAINQFDRRLATLEGQYEIILDNQRRIMDRLDQLR